VSSYIKVIAASSPTISVALLCVSNFYHFIKGRGKKEEGEGSPIYDSETNSLSRFFVFMIPVTFTQNLPSMSNGSAATAQ